MAARDNCVDISLALESSLVPLTFPIVVVCSLHFALHIQIPFLTAWVVCVDLSIVFQSVVVELWSVLCFKQLPPVRLCVICNM